MAIRPVELQGVVQRTQDIGQLKLNQDQKPMTDQNNIQIHIQKEAVQHSQQVTKYDNADKKNEHYDAKEKGNGFYFGKGRERRKKEEDDEDGVVTIKSANSHMDVKI